MKTILIYVEGKDDVRFLEDFLTTCLGFPSLQDPILDKKKNPIGQRFEKEGTKVELQELGGRDKLDDGVLQAMDQEKRTRQIEKILVIFDADNSFENTQDKHVNNLRKYPGLYEPFLLPNHQDAGALETLLLGLATHREVTEIIDNNNTALKQWGQKAGSKWPEVKDYLDEKDRVSFYAEVMGKSFGDLRNTKKIQEGAKGGKREYSNATGWNLQASAAQPLKNFLETHLPQ